MHNIWTLNLEPIGLNPHGVYRSQFYVGNYVADRIAFKNGKKINYYSSKISFWHL